MKTMLKIALVTAALALACGSAALAAGKPEGSPPYGKGAANGKGPTYTPSEPTPVTVSSPRQRRKETLQDV